MKCFFDTSLFSRWRDRLRAVRGSMASAALRCDLGRDGARPSKLGVGAGPRFSRRSTITGIVACFVAFANIGHAAGDLRLWYEEPATVWTEAMPVGNGSLGAMVFGGIETEHLQFNEDTLWTGTVHAYHNEGASAYLDDIRELLWQGKQDEAEELAMEEFMSVPLRQSMYQPFGDIYIDFPGHESATDYERELDLESATATVAYSVDGVRYKRETISSFPDQVLVERISADKPGAVTFQLRMDSPHAEHSVKSTGNDALLLAGQVAPNPKMLEVGIEHEGLRFAARVRVIAEGGSTTSHDGIVSVEGADAVTILLSARTQFKNFRDISADPEAETAEILERASRKLWSELVVDHVEDYRGLFARLELDLGKSPYSDWPTDRRLERADKSDDPQLATLLFQYGRYLLISSSRPGSQAANLQGVWNDQLDPPWGSKYTLNINAEMNYWPAEVANLSETHEPFFDLIDDLAQTGQATARAHYDAPGWVSHHNTDLWRGSAPINHSNHGIWPGSGAWLSQHLWERFRYTQDREFLAERAYPVMKEAALFYSEYLVEDPETGWLISGPSNSPENGGLVMGPTMDHQLIRSLFGWVIEASRILERDEAFAAKLEDLRKRIAPNQIGRYGQLQEWLEDIDDPENKHRHVSHLWGVFPGQDITWAEPELMKAARQSLIFRGDGGTGWALGWKISLWARFLDGDHAHKILMNMFNLVRDNPDGTTAAGDGGGGVYPNLFDAHPPFQIDGNFAATAGIIEMLMQSHRIVEGADSEHTIHKHVIELLPALPSAFDNGSISGVRARGGFELDFSWEDGELTSLTIRSEKGGEARLRYRERVDDVILEAGESKTFGPGMREQKAYTGDRSPLELSQWLMESQVSRFQEWLPEGKNVPPFWDYSLAVVALGCMDLAKATGEEKWVDYAAEMFGTGEALEQYDLEEYNIDSVKPGSPVLELYQYTGEEKYREIADLLRRQLAEHPRTDAGGFWHKKRYPWQMWLDGIYMGSPFLAQYAAMFDEPEAFDDVVHQIVLMDKVAYDPETGLHHHAWDEKRQQPWADPETGLSSNFWSRSIGWYGMAMVDVLDFLPEDHPGVPKVKEILVRWARGIKRWQDPESGLWWQVTNQGDRLGNYLEATGSSQFVYTLAKAINRGYLSRDDFGETLESAWEGIQSHLLDVDDQGRVGLAQCCRVAGLSDDRDGSYEYYLSERIIHNDLKGVGPLIRAGVQLETYFNR